MKNKEKFLEKAGLIVILLVMFESIIVTIKGKEDDIVFVILMSILFLMGFILYLIPEHFLKAKK